MQAAPLGAFHGDARAHDLGKTVDVAVLDAQFATNLVSHMFGSGLCAEDRTRKIEVLRRVIAHFDSRIGDEQSVRRSCAQDIDPEVLHDLDLALGVAG